MRQIFIAPIVPVIRFGSFYAHGQEFIALDETGRAMKDNEGNDVGAVFVWDEYKDDVCGTCGREIK